MRLNQKLPSALEGERTGRRMMRGVARRYTRLLLQSKAKGTPGSASMGALLLLAERTYGSTQQQLSCKKNTLYHQ